MTDTAPLAKPPCTRAHLTEHLNRFGSYELDLSKPPAPLPFELPPRLQPSRQDAAAHV